MLEAVRPYALFAALGAIIFAETSSGFDPRDLLATGPTAAALIIVVFSFLRRLDPMTRAINRNTAVLMDLRNVLGHDRKYTEREIARTEISAKNGVDEE